MIGVEIKSDELFYCYVYNRWFVAGTLRQVERMIEDYEETATHRRSSYLIYSISKED